MPLFYDSVSYLVLCIGSKPGGSKARSCPNGEIMAQFVRKKKQKTKKQNKIKTKKKPPEGHLGFSFVRKMGYLEKRPREGISSSYCDLDMMPEVHLNEDVGNLRISLRIV